MTKEQRNLYQKLLDKNKIEILVTSDFKSAVESKQIFDYLKIDNLLFPDFKAEKFDNLRSYKDEIFDIFKSLDIYYQSDKKNRPTLIFPKSTLKTSFPLKKLREKIYIEFGDIKNVDIFEQNLIRFGYQNSGVVQNIGEYSLNNMTLDIFPINSENPFRVTFSKDNEIEEIKKYSEITQIKFEEVENLDIYPAYFSFSESRYLEILEDIEDYEFNSISPDIQSFGLWFLKDEEVINFQNKQILYLEEIPTYTKFFDIKLEKIEKKHNYQKSNILLDELNQGDYVVHREYGVGIFEKLSKENIFGGVRDFIKIRYYAEQHLFLPIERLALLSRYISGTGKLPKIDKLGKSGFFKKSGKIRDALNQIAKYIVEISAKRKLIKAPIIQNVDLSKLQQSSGFKYTLDQKNSISSILENLNSNYPMDHILIGDVGFGKTEVAINAIYSTIKSGFQVAFIVPTTLLAKQHYTNIKSRFDSFDMKIAHIDKFVKLKDKKEIKQNTESGEIDLIIGTHSILDFKFKKIALLIIDEEQKFGVKQKSKLQELYINIHLLSMSATPIPRTLHQAMSQLKTISRLETPPKERIAVKTFLKEYDKILIKDAILKELKRDGQIFYIFNSIVEIENKKIDILNILPHLKILVLHSKIPAKIMEDEIMKFEKGEYDLLLSTTIIGTGIHIPNVNTILIDGADGFGLADLHQLRGRVGRGEKEGYCYFIVMDNSELTENASKRLLALEENSHLGSGSALAIHDLEIRGGGNIVGESQSGHIDDVGYSLYIQMLEEELSKLTENNTNSFEKGVDIQLSIKAYISENIIKDNRVKLDIYRRVTDLKDVETVKIIELETEDRFGKLDIYSKQFFDLIRIRILANQLQIKSISNIQKKISIRLLNNQIFLIDSPTKDDDDIISTILKFLNNTN